MGIFLKDVAFPSVMPSLRFEPRWSQPLDLPNWYLSLPCLVFSMTTTGLLRVRIIWISGITPWHCVDRYDNTVGQHYKSLHCQTTNRGGRISRAPGSHSGRSGNLKTVGLSLEPGGSRLKPTVFRLWVQNLVESNQRLHNWYLLLSSLVLGIIRI